MKITTVAATMPTINGLQRRIISATTTARPRKILI